MKKLLIFITTAAIMTSCRKSLLDTAPYSSASSETMWTTDGLTDQGVTGVYQALRLSISTGGASGNELYQFDRLGVVGQGRDMDAMLNGTITANSSVFSTNWQQLYEGVKRANDAIHNIPLKSPSSDVKKSRYIAETKFLRAYFYFRLNQLYKGVPLYLEPVGANDASRPRETEAKIWEVVLQDLTDAINEPNLPNKYAAGDGLYGHITKGAAYALRGKTYMYLKQWQNAINDFQKVKDAGYKLFTGSYKDLFTLANEKSDEMIFSIQHINQDGYGSTTQFYCGTRSSFGSCWNTYLISPNLVDLYENADGSPFNWDDVIPGYSAMPAAKREVFFFRDNLTTAEITAATNRGLDMSLYLPTGNEARIKAAYANRDPRLNANVIVPYATYLGRPIDGADRTFTSRWPARLESSPTFDLFTDTRSNFYYLHRKYVYEGSTQLTTRVTGPTDFPIIRYADIALMWAEAINEIGFSQDAVDLVNTVRQRAGVGLLNSSAATTVTNQDQLRERIRDERRREFPNEGINYFDELRWNSWKDKVFYAGNGIKQVWGANVASYTWKGDYIYTWAIPAAEIQINPSLTQNTGWVN
ncbi:MAG: RagB/SusD family nutrient uptake outer membrane protein [Chitinophagaceae bacterium]|nr:RagB/SusD family nutrient uptake outer membrane protein [Chitinophagaceae bacterium]